MGHAHIPQVYLYPIFSPGKSQTAQGGQIEFELSYKEILEYSFESNGQKRFDFKKCRLPSEYSQNIKDVSMAIIQVPSVGQPRDDCYLTGYAIYDSDKRELVMRRLPYNFELTQKKILDARLPEYLASRLQYGH